MPLGIGRATPLHQGSRNSRALSKAVGDPHLGLSLYSLFRCPAINVARHPQELKVDLGKVLFQTISSAVVLLAEVCMVPPLVKLGAQTHHIPQWVSTTDALSKLGNGFVLDVA